MKAHLRELPKIPVYIDRATAEVLTDIDDGKEASYLAKGAEEFYIIYSSLLGLIQEVQMTAPEIKVYAYLLTNYKIGSAIALPKGAKIYMAGKLGLKHTTISNTLVKLTGKKLIYSIARGMYKLNPRYAFKGSTNDRNRLLKFVLQVECPDC